MNSCFLDVETTGLDSRRCHIVEVGAVAVDGDLELGEFSEVCNPGEAALERIGTGRALEINGLTREEIGAARPIMEVARAFRAWMMGMNVAVLHSYNVGFDKGFLSREPWDVNPLSWGECVMRAVSSRRKPVRLEVAARRFGLDFDAGQAHRALYDARAAWQVYRAWQKQREGAVA